MFPQINKRKKKEFTADQAVLKQWQTVSQQLQIKGKLCIKKIPNQILHDFSKVCRIKLIPQFYANYFICSTYKSQEAEMSKSFKQQIQSILTNRSYFHRINQALRQREDILANLRESLQIVEGFILMNQGKNIPLKVRSVIDELVTECESLDKLKEIQRKKTEDFAINVIKIRTNTSQLILLVNQWRQYLQDLNKNEPSSKKILKIYPHQGINCLLVPWYDTIFLRQSILKTQIAFGRDQHDPFLEKLAKNKKGSQIQNYILQYLKADTTNYSEQSKAISGQYPSDQTDKARQKQLQLQQRKQERLKEQKLKQQKLKELRQNKKQTGNLRIVRYGSLKAFKFDKEASKQQLGKSNTSMKKSSQRQRLQKNIINVDLLLSHKNGENTMKESKMFKVYKKGNKRDQKMNTIDISVVDEKEEEFVNERRSWQKQIKEEQMQKDKIKKLLKITEKKAVQQIRMFEQKLIKYQYEVNNLKSKVAQSKKPQRASSSNSKSPQKQKKPIESIYNSNKQKKRQSIQSILNRSINKTEKVSPIRSKISNQRKSQMDMYLLNQNYQNQSRIKQSLQSQIKQLTKQKLKMQRILHKEGQKISKQDELNRKRVEKYEQIINKLKEESENNKKTIKQLELSKVAQDRKISENLRMYTVKQKEQQLKNNIKTKIKQRQARKKNIQESKRKSIQQLLNNSLNRNQKSLGHSRSKEVQIIKTKQTIQIVFQTKKNKRNKEPNNKQINQSDGKLKQLQRERQLLQKKLEMSVLTEQDKKKVFQSKLVQKDSKVQKIRQQVQRQRERNAKLQQNMRTMRKNISSQYELKLNREKMKFEKQRQELLKTIEKEKIQKFNKQRFIQEQMKFLREMQKKEQELIDMLDQQKKQRKNRQLVLAKQLEEKQQLANLIYIEQIKKGIEREVRKQFLESQDDTEQDMLMMQRRLRLQEQIQGLKMQRDQELIEMDEQNQKLKDLIQRIKGEQHQLLEAIKQNIEYSSSEEDEHHQQAQYQEQQKQEEQSPNKQSRATKTFINLQEQNELLTKQLASKTLQQFKHQQHKKQKYLQISQDDNYRQKQKIQNIVELYLKSPHQYPGQQSPQFNTMQKQMIVQDSSKRARQIQDFQNSLFSVKDMPDYVPSMKNSALTNHLLTLRQEYENYEADSLRRELFPPLQDQVYNDKQLSVESQQPPMNTLMDHVRAHNRNHPSKKDDKKNFLAINRMRLMLLQENKKEKQRGLIEQQSKKKAQRQILQRNRKKREEKLQKQRLKEEHEQKLKQLQNKLQKQIKQKKKKLKTNPKQSQNQASSLQKSAILQSPLQSKELSPSKAQQKEIKQVINTLQDEHLQKSSSQSQRQQKKMVKSIKKVNDKNFQIQEEPIDFTQNKKKEQQIIRQTKTASKKSEVKFTPIKQQKQKLEQSQLIQQSQLNEQDIIDQKQEESKKSLSLLKEQLLSIQSQVREYIRSEDQFQVYQQFINEQEVQTYIQQILQLSTKEVVTLNGNSTIKQDIKFYTSLTVLIAKNDKGLQIGIGIFHKEYEAGDYVCDYVLSHDMHHFLNLTFNFSRFIFQNDRKATKVEFIFNLKHIQREQTVMIPFLQFEKKCHRLGEVYAKANQLNQRKYVLKRPLFEEIDMNIKPTIEKGIDFSLKLLVFDDLIRQINQGFKNHFEINYGSISILLAYYLSTHTELLSKFRQKVQNELYYRQILITSLLFDKKSLQLKTVSTLQLSKYNFLQEILALKEQLDVKQVQSITETAFSISQAMPKNTKRCTLSVGYQQIRYLIFNPEESVASLQSSNSSQTGYFLSIIPKYKVMVIEAQQFLAMSSKNPNLTVFFYIKHFIKNIVDVKKESFQRVYLPEISEHNKTHFEDLSKKMHSTVLLKQGVRLGWKNEFSNSIIFSPSHRDLVIQRPFILAVLSGNIERAVEGSPIFVRLID